MMNRDPHPLDAVRADGTLKDGWYALNGGGLMQVKAGVPVKLAVLGYSDDDETRNMEAMCNTGVYLQKEAEALTGVWVTEAHAPRSANPPGSEQTRIGQPYSGLGVYYDLKLSQDQPTHILVEQGEVREELMPPAAVIAYPNPKGGGFLACDHEEWRDGVPAPQQVGSRWRLDSLDVQPPVYYDGERMNFGVAPLPLSLASREWMTYAQARRCAPYFVPGLRAWPSKPGPPAAVRATFQRGSDHFKLDGGDLIKLLDQLWPYSFGLLAEHPFLDVSNLRVSEYYSPPRLTAGSKSYEFFPEELVTIFQSVPTAQRSKLVPGLVARRLKALQGG